VVAVRRLPTDNPSNEVSTMFAFGMPGGWQWLILLVIVLLIFGHRIPGMARALGSGITEFRRGLKDGSGDNSQKQVPAPGEEKPEK
jgi:sec-independent protein translocase protein TatA